MLVPEPVPAPVPGRFPTMSGTGSGTGSGTWRLAKHLLMTERTEVPPMSHRASTILASLGFLLALPSVAPAQDPAAPASGVKDDDLNGLWTVFLDGKRVPDDALTEDWASIGARLRMNGCVTPLRRTGDELSSVTNDGYVDVIGGTCSPVDSAVILDIKHTGATFAGDSLSGTYYGKPLLLNRDVKVQPPIVLQLPGDRPWMLFQTQLLEPAASRDRESFMQLDATKVQAFCQSCVLYKSWLKKFMKGGAPATPPATVGDAPAQDDPAQAFAQMVQAVNGLKSTPRKLTSESQFTDAVKGSLGPQAQTSIGLAISNFSSYFAAGAGRGVRIMVTNDSMIYFMTDKPSRAGLIGVCIMKAPTHGPLASPFSSWLVDMGELPASDDANIWRAMLEVLAKSDSTRANSLTPQGKSVFCDYVGVMAIEHYRDIAFQDPSEQWGYNMTSAMFCGRITRALGNKVIIDDGSGHPTLNPGEPSYFNVLNGGNDMQEVGGMATQKQLTTQWLQAKHPDMVARIKASLAGIVPEGELTDLAQKDVFHFLCQNFYDDRIASLTTAQANEVVAAGSAVMDVIGAEASDLEQFILANGVTASDTPAPRVANFH